MDPDHPVNIPALFLPTHLHLGAANWHEYKHAVETVCRVHGVEENLILERVWPDYLASARDNLEREEWRRCEDVCKAIITLNVKDFSRFGVHVGKDTSARAVWAHLVKAHAPKRRCCQELVDWVGSLTRLELVLLVFFVWFL